MKSFRFVPFFLSFLDFDKLKLFHRVIYLIGLRSEVFEYRIANGRFAKLDKTIYNRTRDPRNLLLAEDSFRYGSLILIHTLRLDGRREIKSRISRLAEKIRLLTFDISTDKAR